MNVYKPADDYIDGIPPLTDKEIEEGARDLTDYLFFRSFPAKNKAKEYFCTACRRTFVIGSRTRGHSAEEIALYETKHRGTAACPHCGKKMQVVNTAIKKKTEDMFCEVEVAFVKVVRFGEVWVRCEQFRRRYRDGFSVYDWVTTREVYRFVAGEGCTYWRNDGFFDSGQRFVTHKTVRDPFGFSSASCLGFVFLPFRWVGLDALAHTFIRYSRFDPFMENRIFNCMAYLDVFSRYPKIIEMLEKRGFDELVEAKVLGRKTRHVCDWNATDYRRFWRLSPEEVKELQKIGGAPWVAEIYKKLFATEGAARGFADAKKTAMEVRMGRGELERLEKTAARYGLEPREAARYIIEQEKKHSGRYMICVWFDYIEAAADCGRDLTVRNVIMPKDLIGAHDEAAAARKVIMEERENKLAEERAKKLDDRYGYENGGYIIRPPKDTKEIVYEGNALKHCVGGYAARHARGETTILFMRAAATPSKPLYTIEIRGKTLIQAHGYQNIKNPQDVPEAQAFIDEWLAWVQAGSKRGKDGKPVVKVKNGQKAGKQKGQAA